MSNFRTPRKFIRHTGKGTDFFQEWLHFLPGSVCEVELTRWSQWPGLHKEHQFSANRIADFIGVSSRMIFNSPLFFITRKPLLLTVSLTVLDRKSTRLNSSHRCISYAVFC